MEIIKIINKVKFFILLAVICGAGLYGFRGYLQVFKIQNEIRQTRLEIKSLSMEVVKTKYLTEGDVPYIIKELVSSLPKGLKIEMHKAIPQPAKKMDGFFLFSVELEYLANFNSAVNYLSKITSLPTPIFIDQINFKSVGENNFVVRNYLSFILMPGKPTMPVRGEIMPPLQRALPVRLGIKKRETKPNIVEKTPALQGVWTGEEEKAIINDRSVSEGETVNGYKVKSIDGNRVLLEKNGKKLELKVE